MVLFAETGMMVSIRGTVTDSPICSENSNRKETRGRSGEYPLGCAAIAEKHTYCTVLTLIHTITPTGHLA